MTSGDHSPTTAVVLPMAMLSSAKGRERKASDREAGSSLEAHQASRLAKPLPLREQPLSAVTRNPE